MIPTSFEQSTHCLATPPGMTEEQCDPLCVANALMSDGTPCVISCWKLTKEELDEFVKTGRIWLLCVGHSMPPVCLTSISPFNESESPT